MKFKKLYCKINRTKNTVFNFAIMFSILHYASYSPFLLTG